MSPAGSRSSGWLTLMLDELALSPNAAARLAEMQRAAPVWLRQLADEMGERAAAAARALPRVPGGQLGTLRADLTPGWLRLGALDALATWFLAEARTCSHVGPPTAPGPMVAAAWKPGLIVCPPCLAMLNEDLTTEADATCDACGRVTAGPQHEDAMWPGSLTIGPLQFLYGTCTACRVPVEPRPQAAHSDREATASTQHELISVNDAAARIAERMNARDSYVITLPPEAFAGTVQRIGKLFGAVIYAHRGADMALMAPGPVAAAALGLVAETTGIPMTGVAVVPKSAPRGLLSRALGRKMPADGAQDIVLLESAGEHRYVWPTLFLAAMDHVDPAYSAAIRAAADGTVLG